MAISLAVLILTCAVIQGHCAGSSDSLELRAAAKQIAAIQGVSDAMQCFGSFIKDSHKFFRRHNDTLTAMESLPDVVLQIKQRMDEQKEEIDSIKAEFTAPQKVEKLAQEIADLNSKLENKETKLQNMETQDRASERIITELNEKVKELTNNLKNMETKDIESKRRIAELNEKVKELGDNVCSPNKTIEATDICIPKGQQSKGINILVEEYTRNKDWGAVRRGIEALLDKGSAEYKQLQDLPYEEAWPLWKIGNKAHTELMTLLLCAGLPVDTSDKDKGTTMLHGAAQGGRLKEVKMLMQRGADYQAKGYNSRTPLHEAASEGRLDVVKWLVEAGADTTTKSVDDGTALDRARGGSHTAVVDYLTQFPH